MTKKELNRLKFKLALNAVLKIIFISFIFIVIVTYLIDYLYNDTLANNLSNIDRNLYVTIVHYKYFIMFIIYSLIISLTTFYVIYKMNDYLEVVIKSIESILNKPENIIYLDDNLSLIERMLNTIRINLITSKNNEQKEINAKNDLIMYMAHDLKTPLTSIIGYLNLLTEEENISKKLQNKYQNIILDKALRLEDLINEFFEITKYDLKDMPILKNNFNLSLLLDQLKEEIYPSLEKKKLKLDMQKEQVIIYNGDNNKIARVFENLLKNAINYSYENTTISIIVNNYNDYIEIIVKNKGDKIPKHKLDKIFDKFYRIDESRSTNNGGSGLGLAISKEIILKHNGTITVNNDTDEIIFTVTLPK